jgi:zinc protease
MRPLRYALLLLLCALASASQAATDRGAPPLTSGVNRTVLPNGLTLLVRESRHAPVVAIVTWVKAGYFDEPDRVAGMAHLFEHMFFKGSEKYPGAQAIATAVRSLGGQTNAGTIYDYTAYHIVVPREAMTAAMEIQADAIAHPLFDPAELKREAEVVIEESNRKYDNAPAFAIEKLFALAYTQHRIRRWRIGSDEVLRNIHRDDLLRFFESLYRPENIVVSVVGDVDTAAAIETATRSYGTIPRGEIRREPGPVEPPQTELRFDSFAGDIQQGYLTVGFHTPGVHSDEDAALGALASVLADGRSARLYRALVRTGLAQDVNANNNVSGDVGTFTIQARLDARRVADVEDRLFEEIERLKRWPVSPFELARAKNLVETDLALGLEDALGQAQSLARYEANGSYKDLDQYVRRIRRLTASQLQHAARRYLTLSNASVLRYLPKNVPIPAGAPPPPPPPPLRVIVSIRTKLRP